jgi:acetyl esterase/lipase
VRIGISVLVVCGMLGVSGVSAQTVWQPSAGHTQVAIWPGAAPDPQKNVGAETMDNSGTETVAGKPYVYLGHVSVPTMTVYKPKGKNTGAAVVVFPGGGFQILAIDLEGTEACDWLTAEGITCVLLKYRVPGVGVLPKSGSYPQQVQALEDAQRTLGRVRFHAKEWGIDPQKIGVMGFSAGGYMVAAMSVHIDGRVYKPVDEVDAVSCRPDFAVAIYPGHLSWSDDGLVLNPDIAEHISKRTPPTFLLQNEDDHVDTVKDSLSYYMGLLAAGVPVEFHSYAQGGHAFGLRPTKQPATRWPELVDVWLRTIGVVGK